MLPVLGNAAPVCGRGLGDSFLRGAFEEFVDESLVGFGLFGGQAAELCEQTGSYPNGDELFGVPGFGAPHAAGATEFFVSRLADIREVNLVIGATIRSMLCALCGSPGAR